MRPKEWCGVDPGRLDEILAAEKEPAALGSGVDLAAAVPDQVGSTGEVGVGRLGPLGRGVHEHGGAVLAAGLGHFLNANLGLVFVRAEHGDHSGVVAESAVEVLARVNRDDLDAQRADSVVVGVARLPRHNDLSLKAAEVG